MDYHGALLEWNWWGTAKSQVTQWSRDLPASAGDARDEGSIPESGRFPGVGNDYSLQYSCLENSTHKGAWRATVCGITKGRDTTERPHANTHTRANKRSSGPGPDHNESTRSTDLLSGHVPRWFTKVSLSGSLLSFDNEWTVDSVALMASKNTVARGLEPSGSTPSRKPPRWAEMLRIQNRKQRREAISISVPKTSCSGEGCSLCH